MATVTKLYLHNAASSDTGTLPGAGSISGNASAVAVTGAATNRNMDGTIGSVQQAPTVATLASTSLQSSLVRRWLSPPMAVQTIPTGAYILHYGAQESNTNAALGYVIYLDIWRPGTGAVVNDMAGHPNAPSTTVQGVSGSVSAVTTVQARSDTFILNYIASFTLAQGDIIVLELWSNQTQTSAMSYVDTFYYDGTTEDSVTSNAAYLLSPGPWTLYTPPPPPPQPRVVSAVQRAATRCSVYRRASGILVPRLWLPGEAVI